MLFKIPCGKSTPAQGYLWHGVPCTGFLKRCAEPSHTTVHEGEGTSPTTYKPYVFSNSQLTGNQFLLVLDPNRRAIASEDESTFGPATASLGEIVVDVEQVIFHATNPRVFVVPIMPPLNVHERAKKGIVHGTQ